MGFFDRLFRSTPSTPRPTDYGRVVRDTAAMTSQPTANALALAHGLNLVNVAWEDTARFQGSCVGPNISDLTIQVHHPDGPTCMPVLRHPNFADRTCDVPLDAITVPVGNQTDGEPRRHVPLRTYLSDLRQFLSVPGSWSGPTRSLLRGPGDAGDDTDVLVSAQACFLPVPKQGEARFNPVLFNYQSRPGAPAVLAILVTREGTSATIIDNQRDAFASGPRWGQRLFHNAHGERASLTGTRVSDFVAGGGDALDAATSVEEAAGLNRVLLIQVPLLQPEPPPRPVYALASQAVPCCAPVRRRASFGAGMFGGSQSTVEEAVIGHGDLEGPFTEIDGQAIRRDPRFPIRVTVQFYQATDNGVCSVSDVRRLAAAIDEVYADGHASGSLVFGDAGRTTAWDDQGQGKAEPPHWWKTFWAQRSAATGRTQQQLQADLATLLGRPVDPDVLEAILGPVPSAPGEA